MSDNKLIIRIPPTEAEMKIVIDILTAYGFSKKNAILAVNNIKNKNSVDDALTWLNENDIFPDELTHE
jgi:hypothetical protein